MFEQSNRHVEPDLRPRDCFQSRVGASAELPATTLLWFLYYLGQRHGVPMALQVSLDNNSHLPCLWPGRLGSSVWWPRLDLEQSHFRCGQEVSRPCPQTWWNGQLRLGLFDGLLARQQSFWPTILLPSVALHMLLGNPQGRREGQGHATCTSHRGKASSPQYAQQGAPSHLLRPQ